MARIRTEQTIDRMAAVAYMLRAGYRAKEIATELNLGMDQVSKLRSLAERQRMLSSMPPVAGPAWTYDHECRAQRLIEKTSAGELKQLLAGLQRRGLIAAPLTVRVFPSVHRQDKDWEKRLDHFGPLCATHVRKLICRCKSVGVSWGATVDSVVRGIEQIGHLPHPRRPVLMLPVCGEPLGYVASNTRLSATGLATRLAAAVNGSSESSRSLSAVPSFIPIDFKDDSFDGLSEVDVVKKLIGRVPAHAEILGGSHGAKPYAARQRQPWIRRLSMVLTSVGLNGIPFGQGSGDYLKAAGLTSSQVRRLATADISGVLLARSPAELPPDSAALLHRIRNHWTGISLEDLLACAKQARAAHGNKESLPLGVVVVAIGQQKAGVILECMRRGIASHLIVDTDLEDGLKALVSAEMGLK